MTALLAFTGALIALWTAVAGIVALAFGYGAVEVLCLEVAGLVVAVLSAALFIVDDRRAP